MTKRWAQIYKLEPTNEQRHQLSRFVGSVRWIWNWGLATKRDAYAADQTTITTHSLITQLPILKRAEETLWLSEAPSAALQQILRDLDAAYGRFFKKQARFPHFKKKGQRDSFRIPQGVKLDGDYLYCPSLGWLKVRLSRPVDGSIKSATFRRDSCGDWFVSLALESDADFPDTMPIESSIGIDVGLSSYATYSDGSVINNPRWLRTAQRRLGRAQRRLSKRQNGSNNRGKMRLRVARLHRKVARQRLDLQHKLTTALVKKYDLIAIEDLNIKGLVRTKLARSFADAAFGELFRQLVYKCQWYGKSLVKVGRFYPSSKTCSHCGNINKELLLKDRVWTCAGCGVKHLRDWNASQNILSEGLRMFAVGYTENGNACGQRVSLATASSAG